MNATLRYRENQRPVPAIVIPSSVLGSAITGIACGSAVVDGKMPFWAAFALLAVVAAFMMWLLAIELRVEEAEEGLVANYVGLRRRVARWSDIKSAEATTFRPIRDHGGWGIRLVGKRYWAYTASGNRGVLLEMKDGSRLVVGSARAEELETVVRARLG